MSIMNTVNQPTAATATPKKKGWVRRSWPYAAVAVGGLVLGGAVGSAGATDAVGDPTPAKTITVEKEVEKIVEVDSGVCRDVAQELFGIAQTTVDGISTPYGEVVQILITQLTDVVTLGAWAFEASEIDRGTAILADISATTESLTSRVDTLSPAYAECVNG